MKAASVFLLFAFCLLFALNAFAVDIPPYPLTQDSMVHDNVPHGKLEGPFEFHSKIIVGAVHRYWIYVPAQYSAKSLASLLVFHDGQRATNPDGPLRIQTVLDNLIAKKDIPVTIGLFITPGNLSEHYPNNLGMDNPDHRAEEYDALDDRYSRFLINELLPVVFKQYNISRDPDQHIIGGTSSGAICAFTVAWHHPDVFHKVISMIGSFTSIGYKPAHDGKPMIPGGDLYPTLIRKTPIKPINIFLQDGSNDLNNEHGNWFLSAQQMISALEWANANADQNKVPGSRYIVNHVWGEGNHSDQHGGSLLPDILRWMAKTPSSLDH